MKELISPSQIPEDFNTAIRNGKVRVPSHIISTISDERGMLLISYKYGVFSMCIRYKFEVI